jgi:deoxyribodipyrimidine photo-lyase
MSRAIHIFRRDLRIHDNTALRRACEEHDEVLPVFCADPRQLEDNEYRSDNAVQFMVESLQELREELRSLDSELHVYNDKPEKVVKHLEADAVYINQDVTPFSKKRDKALQNIVENSGATFHSCHDAYLAKPGTIKTQKGTMYKVYSSYKKKAEKTTDVPKPQSVETQPLTTLENYRFPDDVWNHMLGDVNDALKVHGGRGLGLSILDDVEQYADYDEDREYPDLDATTHLSAYLKFGCVSPREAYWALREEFGASHGLITELWWRDFYAHLLDAYPRVLNNNMKEKYDAIPWREDPEGLQRWKEGRTGVPIVDAAMRQLTSTGWMHNRCRMIVASYLCKDLRVHWKEGEKFFAQHLVDYDPASNNGGWQWAASTGADSQPYFRIFNPWRQQERYDEDADYIKTYVPELRGMSAEGIHGLEDAPVPDDVEYPEQIVDHSEAAKKTKEVFKKALN